MTVYELCWQRDPGHPCLYEPTPHGSASNALRFGSAQDRVSCPVRYYVSSVLYKGNVLVHDGKDDEMVMLFMRDRNAGVF